MNKEVEVYRRDNNDGHLRMIATFDSLEDLVSHTTNFDNFSCNSNDRHDCGLFNWDSDYHKLVFGMPLRTWKTTDYCYVVYNANNKIVPPDVLVGLNRRARRARLDMWRYRYGNGYKRGNGHCYRRPKTTQEHRWAHAWDDEEFAPKPRGRRCGHNLPTAWDDIWRWKSDSKSWKNYRKTQWKTTP